MKIKIEIPDETQTILVRCFGSVDYLTDDYWISSKDFQIIKEDDMKQSEETVSDKPSKVEPFTAEEKVMFIDMINSMREECENHCYYRTTLDEINRKVRAALWDA